jgi:hypothetical protein
MKIYESELQIPAFSGEGSPLDHVTKSVVANLPPDVVPVRFVISKSDSQNYQCEVGVMGEATEAERERFGSIFEFRKRTVEDTSSFNVAFIVPTGIGSTIGGHAGDSTPAAQLIGAVCDRIILHPNVVNASDINEMPANAFYVEGSVLSRLLMGTAGLQPVRANRVLTVMDNHPIDFLRDATINTVSSARATYGLSCDSTVLLDPPIDLDAVYTTSGRASGTVENMDGLVRLLSEREGSYDAVALATMVKVPIDSQEEYFSNEGEMINPWGGAEAIFTHTVSSLFDVPTAHAPITADEEIADLQLGLVDPRKAAEAISFTYFQCVLKGLRQSPKIVTHGDDGWPSGALTAENVSCLVMPDGAVGLPTLAALQQGIPVIAVRENENILENDLTALPWAPGQLHIVENYWEALGVLVAIKAGIDPLAARRPLADTAWEVYSDTP